MSKFTFGTPTTTAAATSFGFNTQTPATGGFGTGTTFGAVAATPASGAAQPTQPGLNFNFGATPTATANVQPNLSLGGGSATGTNLFQAQQPQGQTTALGQTSTIGQTPALGQTATLGQTPGQATALGQSGQSTGLTFGTPNAAKPAGLTFGTPATSQPTGLTTGGALSFGTPTTTAGTLSFGTSAAASTGGTGGLSFGTITTNPATTGGLTFGATATAGGLSFGGTTSAAAPTSSALSFGATVTTAPSSSSLFGTTAGGLFGTKPTTTAIVATTTSVTTTNKGLGGLDVSVTNKGLTQGLTSPTAAKENLLPNELMQTIDGFKEFVKMQKVLSSDIARGSARPLSRCSEDTASLMEILTTLAGSVQRDRSLADKLKQDTAKALQNAEIAQRTHDTPAGLQYENNAPLLFFMDLAENFEHDLMLFKSQIETTEKHIQTMMTPKTLTPQELTMAMSKLHESLVAVAGRLQGVHTKVQQQKEQYLNFRKYVLKDSTNVFEDVNKADGKSSRNSISKITSGPTPFGPGNRTFISSTALNSTQQPNLGTQNPLAWGSVYSTPGTNLTLNSTMKPPTTGLNFNPPTNLTAPLSTDPTSSFQLQKPPVGNKRGKH